MKTVTAKEFRSRAAVILKGIIKGDEVIITMRRRPIAVMKPVIDVEKPFNPIGFGMWKGRREMTPCHLRRSGLISAEQ